MCIKIVYIHSNSLPVYPYAFRERRSSLTITNVVITAYKIRKAPEFCAGMSYPKWL